MQQLRQRGEVHRQPASLVLGEQLARATFPAFSAGLRADTDATDLGSPDLDPPEVCARGGDDGAVPRSAPRTIERGAFGLTDGVTDVLGSGGEAELGCPRRLARVGRVSRPSCSIDRNGQLRCEFSSVPVKRLKGDELCGYTVGFHLRPAMPLFIDG